MGTTVKPDARAPAMPEAQLQAEVARLCRRLGGYHMNPNTKHRSEPRGPASTIIGRTIIYRELKSQFGRLTREQTAVGYRIQAAGGNFKVWRPSDWLDGTIAAELTEVAAVQTELFSA